MYSFECPMDRWKQQNQTRPIAGNTVKVPILNGSDAIQRDPDFCPQGMKGSLQHNLVAFTALVWMALPDPLCMQHCNPLSILTNSGHLIWDPTSQPQALLLLFLTFRFPLWSLYLRTHLKKPHSLPTQHQPPTISASRSLNLVFPQKHEQEWSNTE